MVQTQFFCSTRDGDIGLILLLLVKGRFKNENISAGSSPHKKSTCTRSNCNERTPASPLPGDHICHRHHPLLSGQSQAIISSSLANHKQLIIAFTLTEDEGFCFFLCLCVWSKMLLPSWRTFPILDKRWN